MVDVIAYTAGELAVLIGVFFTALGGFVTGLIAAVRAGHVATEVTAVHQDTKEVNAAVNHKETGMPTLAQRVIDQDKRELVMSAETVNDREYRNTVLAAVAEKVGADIPPPPPPNPLIIAPALPGADSPAMTEHGPFPPPITDIRDLPLGG